MKLTLKKKTYSFRNHIKANINTFQSLNPKKLTCFLRIPTKMLLSIGRLPDLSQTSKTLLISRLFILLLVLETEIRDFLTAAGK